MPPPRRTPTKAPAARPCLARSSVFQTKKQKKTVRRKWWQGFRVRCASGIRLPRRVNWDHQRSPVLWSWARKGAKKGRKTARGRNRTWPARTREKPVLTTKHSRFASTKKAMDSHAYGMITVMVDFVFFSMYGCHHRRCASTRRISTPELNISFRNNSNHPVRVAWIMHHSFTLKTNLDNLTIVYTSIYIKLSSH